MQSIGPKEGCSFFGVPHAFFSLRPTEIIIRLENWTQGGRGKELGLVKPEEVRVRETVGLQQLFLYISCRTQEEGELPKLSQGGVD